MVMKRQAGKRGSTVHVSSRIFFLFKKKPALTEDSMPWLSELVTGLSPQRLRFNPRLFRARFVVDEVALVQISL